MQRVREMCQKKHRVTYPVIKSFPSLYLCIEYTNNTHLVSSFCNLIALQPTSHWLNAIETNFHGLFN